MWRRLLILSLMLAPAHALAQASEPVEALSQGPDRAGVVVYRDQPVDTADLLERSRQPWNDLTREGLALIVERRTIDLPAGEAVIRFRGVATGIVPQSATLDGLPGGVVERNIDFDILSPGSLLKKSVGETVTVVRTNPVTGEAVQKRAVLRSAPGGVVVEVDGRFEALSCSGLTERIVFDALPEGLSDQPVLSVRTRAAVAGRYVVTLAYLATGLQWSADYVARLNPDGRTLALEGWLTLANFGGTGFPDAPVQVVAGTLRREDGTRPVDPVEVVPQPACWPSDTTTNGAIGPTYREDRVEYNSPPVPAPMAARGELDEIVITGSRIMRRLAEQGDLGDYKIYTLPEPTTVAARQTKQVRFMEREGVAYDRVYRAWVGQGNTDEPQPSEIQLRLRNETRTGLGLALPGGTVAVMQPDGAGGALLAGEDRFEDKGVGLPVRLTFGQSPDVRVATRRLSSSTTRDKGIRTRRAEMEVTVTNARSEAVTVDLSPQAAGRRGFRILSQSIRSRIDDTGYPVWTLIVPANGAATLRVSWQTTD